jgi:hypothetical protein
MVAAGAKRPSKKTPSKNDAAPDRFFFLLFHVRRTIPILLTLH